MLVLGSCVVFGVALMKVATASNGLIVGCLMWSFVIGMESYNQAAPEIMAEVATDSLVVEIEVANK